VLNANMADFLMENPHLWPWKNEHVCFFGTIFDILGGMNEEAVVMLALDRGGKLQRHIRELRIEFYSNNPVAVRAS